MTLALSALANLDAVCRLFGQVKSAKAAKVLVSPRTAFPPHGPDLYVQPALQRLSDNAHSYFQPQVVSEERDCLAGTERETGCTPVNFPPSEIGSLYLNSESDSHRPPQFSPTVPNPAPVYFDYNTPQDFDTFWSSASAAQQEIMASSTGIGPVTAAIIPMQPIPEVAYYGGEYSEEQPIIGSELDASWQNFMHAYYQPLMT
jgi:hypothetical protein